ncbi:CBS domain-containing protein [Streptomyces sioyaensis]|uniref:CBS domain-containing protein n=1 Tax=Streptomyces sioyaensis TaxID=67364 RepID=UPI00378FADF6
MTTAVERVRRDTGFRDISVHLAEPDITAVPVLDRRGHPIGVVSDADLLRKQESQTDPGGHLTAAHLRPAEPVKAHALTAADFAHHLRAETDARGAVAFTTAPWGCPPRWHRRHRFAVALAARPGRRNQRRFRG